MKFKKKILIASIFSLLFVTLTFAAVNYIAGKVSISEANRYRILVSKRNSNGIFIPQSWKSSSADGTFRIDLASGVYHLTPHRMGYEFTSDVQVDLAGKIGPLIIPRSDALRTIHTRRSLRGNSFGIYGEGGFVDATGGGSYPIIGNFESFDFFMASPIYLPIRYRNKNKTGMPLEYFCSSGPQALPCLSQDFQYKVSNGMTLENLAERIDILRQKSKLVTLVTGFYANLAYNQVYRFEQDKTQRSGGTLPQEKEYYSLGLSKLVSDLESRLMNRFGIRLSKSPVAGIVLEEENIYDSSPAGFNRRDFLSQLYQSAIISKPALNFLQWYTMTKCSNAPGDTYCNGNGVVQMPLGDGVVFDQYYLDQEYASYIQKMSNLGTPAGSVPLTSIVWAAPNWNLNATQDPNCGFPGNEDNDWWNTDGWKQFYRQVGSNIKNDVPTLFYLTIRNGCGTQAAWRANAHSDPSVKAAIHSFVNQLHSTTIPQLKVFHSNGTLLPDPNTLTQIPPWIPKFCTTHGTTGC